jgi:hypothetical protein
MRISIPILALAAIVGLACPSLATATNPSVVSNDPAQALTVFRVGAAPADLVVREDPLGSPAFPFGSMTFADGGNALVSRPACDQSTPVNCPHDPMEIRLGPLADHADVFTVSFNTFATILGGGGDDRLAAAALFEDVRGGAGDDFIKASAHGADILGNGGDDSLYAREESVNLIGGDGNDLMLSDAGPGARMEGGDGYDVLLRGNGIDPGGAMDGGADDDIIGFESGSGAAAPSIAGGGGHDSIHGSQFADQISGGPGNDEVWAFGGGVDQITCGSGWDEVYVDALDTTDSNCERVTVGAGPSDPRFENALVRAAQFRAASV